MRINEEREVSAEEYADTSETQTQDNFQKITE